jgi:uncharacterized membrane protein YphA (DoxX/SURF4 family)
VNIALWIGQGLLSLLFAWSGVQKGTRSKASLVASGQTGVQEYPMPFVRFIAFMELLAAVGLVVPWATGILPILTPLAAAGLGIIMLGAARAHARLHEPRNVAANFLILAVCLFVTIGRTA